MKWVKWDPAAFLEGVIGLSAEERGFYITLISLQYARAPHNHHNVTDELVVKAMGCYPQVWRRVKAKLIACGKVRETDGKLTSNRVDTEVVSAEFRMQNLARFNQVSALKRNEIKALTDGVWHFGHTRALDGTTTTRSRSKESSFLTAAREEKAEEKKRPSEKQVWELSRAELEQRFEAKRK
jgi:hypothetical protein